MEFPTYPHNRRNEFTNQMESDKVSSESTLKQDEELSLRYFSKKMNSYESNINSTYLNIKKVLNQLEHEFPEIDITSIIIFYSSPRFF